MTIRVLDQALCRHPQCRQGIEMVERCADGSTPTYRWEHTNGEVACPPVTVASPDLGTIEHLADPLATSDDYWGG